jgi:hypothetical protein
VSSLKKLQDKKIFFSKGTEVRRQGSVHGAPLAFEKQFSAGAQLDLQGLRRVSNKGM